MMIGILLFAFLASSVYAAIPDIYSGCGVTKGCFGLPSGCLDDQTCSVVSSFAKYDETSLLLEVYGDTYNGEESYIAVGFSEDMRMNNDSVTECVIFGGVVDIFQSANQPDDPNLIHRNRRLATNKLGLTLLDGQYAEGKLYCQFIRETVLNINGIVYDLTNDYHLLMAAGTAIATGVREHDGTIFGLSASPVDFDAFAVQRKVNPRLRKVISSVYEGCGTTKGCFGNPRYCEPTSNCNLIVTYQRYDENSYEFELYGQLYENNNSYLAVGFSFDGDMDDDSVTECVQRNYDFQLYNSYNKPAGLIRSNRRLPKDGQTGLNLIEAAHGDGYMYCKFTRDNIQEIEGKVFDLTKEWYLLIASGGSSETNLKTHEDGGYASHGRYAVSLDIPAIPTTLDPTQTTTPSGPAVYDGCGSIKGCFGIPRNCEVLKNCSVLVTYAKADEENYQFELFGEIHEEQNTYLAVGFSFDSDMDEDSVSECVLRPNGVQLHHSYNYRREFENIPRRNRRLKANEQTGQILQDSNTIDGFFYCKFIRENVKVVNGTEFDLRNEWYLLLASGGATDTNLLTHEDGGHVSHTLYSVSLDNPSIPTVTTQSPPVETHPVYSGCGETKGCFGHPNNCVDSASCNTIITYKNSSATEFEFELYGVMYSSKKHKAAGSYVAVGFSSDTKMGDDSVTDCSIIGNTVAVSMSYNRGHHNERLEDPLLGIELLEGKQDDGHVYCRFLRQSVIEHSGRTFDIANTDYHLLLAAGPADIDYIHEHHTHASSQDKVHLNDFGSVRIRESENLFTWHGIFMTLAWMLFISAASFLPRHHKQSWVDKQIFGGPVWFSLHRLLTGVAVFLTMYGFIIIFLAVGGWVSPDDPIANTHAILGIIITVLTFIQPFATLLRPAPDHPKRWIFNIGHACVGYGLYVLAVINMFLGSILRDGFKPWARWIVVAFAVVYLLAQLAHFLFKRAPVKSSSTENILQSGKQEQSRSKAVPVEVVWYCYIIAALGCAIALIVALA